MDLIANNRIIAAIEIRPAQLARLLGAFELVIPVSGTVHPSADAVFRYLTTTLPILKAQYNLNLHALCGRAKISTEINKIAALPVLDLRQSLPFGGCIAFQFVCHA